MHRVFARSIKFFPSDSVLTENRKERRIDNSNWIIEKKTRLFSNKHEVGSGCGFKKSLITVSTLPPLSR
jgi:hypothetical protein